MRLLVFVTLAVVSLALVAVPIGATPTNATQTETPLNQTDDGLDAGDVRTVVNNTTLPNGSAEIPNTTAAARSSTATDTSPSPTAHSSTNGERIDGGTVLVSSEWQENESVALITLRSEIDQDVTLTDAGKFSTGGTVPERTVEIDAGETTTVEIPVTEVDGRVGVGIATRYTLYAEIIKSPSGGLDILRALSSLQAWIAGATIAFVWMVIAGWNVMRREDGRPEVA